MFSVNVYKIYFNKNKESLNRISTKKNVVNLTVFALDIGVKIKTDFGET